MTAPPVRVVPGLALVVAAVLGSLPARADDELRARTRLVTGDAGPESYRVGQPILVEIEARHPPGGVALLSETLDLPDALGERRTLRSHRRRLEKDVEVDVYSLQLIPFRAGLIEIPSFRLALGKANAETEPVLVQVDSRLDEAEQTVATSTRPETLAALENMAVGDPPPEAILIPDPRPALGLLGLTAVALILVFGRKLWTRRSLRPRPAPSLPPPPAHETALERLEALAGSGLVERGEHNAFYTELSWVIRSYLGQRYGFDALERTIEELTEALEHMSTPGLDRTRLSGLLNEADQIKFAKYQPAAEDAASAVQDARQLVERTRFDPTSELQEKQP